MNPDGDLLRSKNVTAVTKPFGGGYCIDPGSGIDPTTAVMVVGEEFAFGGTAAGSDNTSQVLWRSDPIDCPAGTMEVLTLTADGRAPSLGETDLGGFDLVFADQSFSFVIP